MPLEKTKHYPDSNSYFVSFEQETALISLSLLLSFFLKLVLLRVKALKLKCIARRK